MQPLQLFDYAYRQNVWLAQRQSVVSSNVANANTPGYRAKDVESFDDVMRRSIPLSSTNANHIGAADADNGVVEAAPADAEITETGNDVNLEQEFVKAGEISRKYTMNTQVMKAFTRMLQSVTKS